MEGYRLSPHILLRAYMHGCFPMPDQKDPQIIRWYRPDPRAIIPLEEFHVSHSMKRELKRTDLRVSYDTAFAQVMQECAHRPETWITEDILRAYCELHQVGFAHSVEIFRNEKLVGGVYGVTIGGAFFAESMFYTEKNMSKLALIKLVEKLRAQGFLLLECQFVTEHLKSLGAREIPDFDYMNLLSEALEQKVSFL